MNDNQNITDAEILSDISEARIKAVFVRGNKKTFKKLKKKLKKKGVRLPEFKASKKRIEVDAIIGSRPEMKKTESPLSSKIRRNR